MSENIGRFIDALHFQNYIDKHTYSFLKPLNASRRKYIKIPQHQPIVSGCCEPTEKISAYLDHYLKPLVPLIPSYTRDSFHIVSTLETTPFPQNCILATINVSSLHLIIPQHF